MVALVIMAWNHISPCITIFFIYAGNITYSEEAQDEDDIKASKERLVYIH